MVAALLVVAVFAAHVLVLASLLGIAVGATLLLLAGVHDFMLPQAVQTLPHRAHVAAVYADKRPAPLLTASQRLAARWRGGTLVTRALSRALAAVVFR